MAIYEDDQDTLERSGVKKPDLQKIADELNQASVDSGPYLQRIATNRGYWMNEWDGQSIDGRKWWSDAEVLAGKAYPWNGCSDSRLRIVSTFVNEHVMLCLAAWWSGKKQAKSIRPFVSGREVNITQRMLDWRIDTHMRRELLWEIPYALRWKFGGGLSFIKVEWEQQRELAYVPINLDVIGQLAAQLGLGDVIDRILDPDGAFDDDLITVMQTLSPVLPTAEARTVLRELRESGQSQLPVTSLRVNKPKWTAKRPLIDVIFPSETCDIQQTRFTCERELVSETELEDRIHTDGYDPDFVEEVLKHKGVFSSWWAGNQGVNTYIGSNRDLVELSHVLSWRLSHNGTPCLYRTVFNEGTIGDELCAVHRKFEYDHGQIPLVALRRGGIFRPLLSSIGIAEEAYTDEMDIKRQQDGLNDHAEIVAQPPMILPTLRAQAQSQQYGPRAVLTSMRPESVIFPPIPPWDQTPLLAMQMVEQRLNRRYPINGANVDPEIKSLYRQQTATDTNGELDLALEQTLQLMQQFETDEDIKMVSGGDPQEFKPLNIKRQYQISTTVDINLIDIERAGTKLDMLAKMLPFKQGGGVVFKAAAQIVDPDLADALTADEMSPTAMERERSEEYAAIGQIMGGVEPVKPMMANPDLRLQVIQEIMSQPQMMQYLGQDKIKQKLLANRVQFYQLQKQQFQANPQIGRTLATQTFKPSLPASVSNQPAA